MQHAYKLGVIKNPPNSSM